MAYVRPNFRTKKALKEALVAEQREDTGPVEFGPERLSNGRINHRRANALYRYAKFTYEYDRD